MRFRYLCWTVVRLLGALILLVGEVVHSAGRNGQLRNERPKG
jgi:hypothetical protein